MHLKLLVKILPAILIFSSCASVQSSRIISPKGVIPSVEWREDELFQASAVRNIEVTEQMSSHIIRINQSEKPHIHATHDLTVFVLSGSGFVNIAEKRESLTSGDVVFIPKGAVHWGELINNVPMEVFVVFTPPFDGKDVISGEGVGK